MVGRTRVTIMAALATAGLAAAGAAMADSAPTLLTRHQPTRMQPHNTQHTDQTSAQRWHLNPTQWQRYKHLSKGLAHYRSNRLDPITLLGIHARTTARRRAYAERLVRMEHKRVEQILAFQKAYDAAWKRLYPKEKPVARTTGAQALAASRATARRLGRNRRRRAVFVDVHGCPACRTTVKRLAQSGQPMDIYAVDAAGDDDAIRHWARRVGLKTKRVLSGAITLNHASAAAAKRLVHASLPRVLNAGGS